MKLYFILFFLSSALFAQETPAESFWKQLQHHCGKSYEGTITQGMGNDDFDNKKLLMHVRSCEENEIKIPFFVGENKSRTWILRLKDDKIQLKHDHRKPDGTEDKITQYGGTSSNTGLANIQVFPADKETADLIPAAATNVWWISLDEEIFSYNLKRIGSNTNFTVEFDLSNPVETPDAPWGWEE
ncbi:hypothetical protein LB465_14440 [Salegentibacter sp. LM13S]|uniref:hypothetical protein n=1 Tax=Salegentibacter lacus TaxID=2873599 RepID=UPI001CCFB127|nr:hypothetical protein [Salegentibacter lacus]MBZ9631979.1 hypothetical protein [Salegentibacter lacus]